MKSFGLAGMVARFETFNVSISLLLDNCKIETFNINAWSFQYKLFSPVGITAKTEFFNINVLVLLHGITAIFQTFNVQITKYFYFAGITAS